MADPLFDDLLGLLCFARAVEHRSFSRAAEALGVSKSVVSARIGKIEGRLGERLIVRTTRKLEITDLQLSDGRSRALLANGDFAGEMAHWFFSSDRYHLPWHIKNLPLHLLFDQGLLGLLLFGALLLVAMLRLCFGRGREHVLAPALAASLIGFLAVGLFDSLIDAPRMAFMFYAVLLVSLGLRALPGAVGAVAAVASTCCCRRTANKSRSR